MKLLARVVVGCLVAACGLLLLTATASARGLQVAVTQGESFPDRSLVLTLPQRLILRPDQVRVTENGHSVRRLTVTPGDQAGPRTFGVVLVIDASDSMRGQAIEKAMAAARAFAAHRPANQQLGVIFFNRASSVVLPLTTDSARIDQTLARSPLLQEGTRIFDATSEGLRLLTRGGVSSGSLVILSDGADVDSSASLGTVAAAARQNHVRLFTVGLRSASFDGSSLRSLASSASGSYGEAASSQGLSSIFGALATSLANEYLIRYQSLSPLSARVQVAASVAGISGRATTSYTAPASTSGADPGRRSSTDGAWSAPWLTAGVAVVIALLLGLAIYAFARPKAAGLRSRVADFVPEPERLEDLLADPRLMPSTAVLRSAEDRLSQYRWWERFKVDVEIARIEVPPVRLALSAVTFALAGAAVSGDVVGNVAITAVFLLSPILVVMWVRVRAGRHRRTFDEQLPDNLQVIAAGMRAGQSFVGAMDMAADEADEPARREFHRIVADDQLGVPLATAVGNVAERMRSAEFEYVGLVAQLQRETGGNTAEVIDRVTETIRERAEIRRTIRTLTAQGRMGGAVVSLLPVALGLVLTVLKPDYLDPLLNSTAGVVALAAASTGIFAGWLAIRRIVDIKV